MRTAPSTSEIDEFLTSGATHFSATGVGPRFTAPSTTSSTTSSAASAASTAASAASAASSASSSAVSAAASLRQMDA